jgi:hypothetical protein
MLILNLPTTPAFSAARFGLVSNTQTFVSPLSGQAQSLERPGARWRADYKLPPMKRAQAAAWQSFLLQLRGGAGRFYGYDPDARTPRGSASALALAARNNIRNGDAIGAINGVFGSGGQGPTHWQFGNANGLTRTVIGSGVEAGISYVEVRFQGTPSGNFTSLIFDTNTITAVEGEVWTGSFYYRLTSGSVTNITAVQQRLEQLNGSTVTNTHWVNVGTVDSTWRRAVATRTMSDTAPDTNRIRPAFYMALTVGAPIDITLRIGHVMLEKTANPSAYIPTTSAARERGTGPRIDGAGQSGTQLATWNWTASQTNILRAGDYIAFDTALGRSLHQIVLDANSDANGRAVVQLEPPLRGSPPDNALIITSSASCIMGLVEDSVSWESDAQGVLRLSFAAEERL